MVASNCCERRLVVLESNCCERRLEGDWVEVGIEEGVEGGREEETEGGGMEESPALDGGLSGMGEDGGGCLRGS